jgi:uncharacterized protein YdaU (DUF1376 family)
MTKRQEAPWVKWYASNWIAGTRGMSLVEIGLYDTILNMIYDDGAPVRDDIVWLGRIVGERPTTVDKILNRLVVLEKLMRVDGVISNKRAEREIETRTKVFEKWTKNFSITKPSVSEKSKEINKTAPQAGDQSEDQVDRRTRTRTRISKKDSYEERGAAQPRPPSAATPARRIDPNRQISNSNIVFAKSRGLKDREIKIEWEKFVRYYRGLSGTRATSPDWDAMWESWVLRSAERLGRDSFVEEANGHPAAGPESFSKNDWIKIVEVWRVTNNWNPSHGPEPGRPGCLAPPDVVKPS